MTNKNFSSVLGMVNELSAGDSLGTELKRRIASRRVVKKLQALRVAKDIPQSRIAEELRCSQSRVSKIESGDDLNLRLGEVEAYARSLGCTVEIAFISRGENSAERVKRYACAIKRELDTLAEVAHKDDTIASGVAEFFCESVFNLMRFIESASKKLPLRPDNGEPYLKISMASEESALECAEVNSKDSPSQGKKPKRKSTKSLESTSLDEQLTTV